MRQIGMLQFKEPEIDASRKILHVDMDAFYAAVEQRDHPELRGKPVIIARHPRENSGKGVVSTASYEARQFGIHSAMSAAEAYERCPQGIFISGNHHHYREVSNQIQKIFYRYTDLIEPLSIDEAFLDVTVNKCDMPYAMDIAREIQQAISNELHLTCSIGVSYNKFIAKLASDYQKPCGMTIITPKRALDFLAELPIEDFYGVGKRASEKMHELGVFKGVDLLRLSQEDCLRYFGKMGLALYERVRGVDDRPVRINRERKSIGKETTRYPFLQTDEEVESVLRHLAQSVSVALAKKGRHGKVITLKLRYGDFRTMTRQKSLLDPIHTYENIYFHALELWQEYGEAAQGVRLLGVTISDLTERQFENVRLPLYNHYGGQNDGENKGSERRRP